MSNVRVNCHYFVLNICSLIILVGCFFFIFPSIGRSDQPSEEIHIENGSYLSIAGNFFGVNYTEHIAPPTDGEYGALGGVNIEAMTVITGQWFVRGDGDFDFGSTQYIGALLNGTPKTSATNNVILDGELVSGFLFLIGKSTTLAPYAGFGSHFWHRGLTGTGSYTERYLFFYLPIGLRFETRLTEDFSFGLDVAFRWNLGGTIWAYLSQLYPPDKDATGTLGPAVGFKIQAPLVYWLGPSIGLRLVPFFEYFDIGQGNSFPTYFATGAFDQTLQEPSSTTYFYGVRLGLAYYF
ncbi:MAG: hypothetical protein HY537_06550 [Deltaproteobacteria bacterium]|nr:hypothetical protein [Deltaproteobacteria bacterium]